MGRSWYPRAVQIIDKTLTKDELRVILSKKHSQGTLYDACLLPDEHKTQGNIVTLHLTYCATCAQNVPDFLATLHQLQREHPDELYVVELDCMAACDAAPAVIIELDEDDDTFEYVPRIRASQLYHRIRGLI
jgi:hypothetical protein